MLSKFFRLEVVRWSLVFFLTRLVFALGFPIFNDESMYLRWGLEFINNPAANWSLSLIIDGKQPGLAVLYGLLLRISGDALILGRLLSVLAATGSFILLLATWRRTLPGKKLTFPALFLITSPFLLFFESLALAEVYLDLGYSLLIYLIVCLWQKADIRKFLLAGVTLAAGWWFKSTMLLALPAFLLAILAKIGRRKNNLRQYGPGLAATLAVFVLGILPLMLTPEYHNIPLREKERIFGLAGLISFPVSVWAGNLIKLLSWETGYLSAGIFLIAVWAVVISIRRKQYFLFLLFALLPAAAEVLESKIFTSRYLLISIPPLLFLASVRAEEAGKKAAVLVKAALILSCLSCLLLIVNPLIFRQLLILPDSRFDFAQYVIGDSSGYGVKNAADYIRIDAKGNPSIVFVRPDTGNPEDAMFVYFKNDANILPARVDYAKQIIKNIQKRGYSTVPVYFVSRSSQFWGLSDKLSDPVIFSKPDSPEYVGVYRLFIR